VKAKFGGRAISEGLRMEAGENLRVTIISPGFVRTNFAEGVTNPEAKAQLESARDKFALPPEAIAHAIYDVRRLEQSRLNISGGSHDGGLAGLGLLRTAPRRKMRCSITTWQHLRK
jgi:NAD(P)-dependent dehydrogenase (short-subunit alcohol dehydrogenase family)